MTDEITLTDQLIEAGKSAAGGFSKAQFAEIVIAWPLLKSWKKTIIGQRIHSERYTRFLAMKK